MKKIIIVTVVLIVTGAVYGYFLYEKKTPDVVNKTPDVTISAGALIDAFHKDPATATKKFIDKIVEVTGQIKRIDTSGAVVLGEEGSVSEVTVGFDRRHAKDYENLQPGSIAVLQGICTGSANSGTSTDSTDLLADLGTTVELRSAGVKRKK